MNWIILVNGEERAMFKEELDAMQYRDFLKNLYKMGGYKDKVELKKKELYNGLRKKREMVVSRVLRYSLH
mgnify:CR=1 FL=1